MAFFHVRLRLSSLPELTVACSPHQLHLAYNTRCSAEMSEFDYEEGESTNDFPAEYDRESDEDTEDASETDMLKQESDCMEIREQIYRDKLAILKEQLRQIEDGTHPEYLRQVRVIEDLYEERLQLNDAFLAVEIERIEQEFIAEQKAVGRDFEDRKLELRENLITELEEKRKNIENEKISLEFNSDCYEPKPATTRKLRRRPNDPTPAPEKRKRGSPAQLNQLLEEHEIIDDLKTVNRAIATSSKMAVETEPTTGISGKDHVADARIDDGKLFFEKKWFHRGQQVVIKCSDNSEFSGILASINTAEVRESKIIHVNQYLKILLLFSSRLSFVRLRMAANSAFI